MKLRNLLIISLFTVSGACASMSESTQRNMGGDVVTSTKKGEKEKRSIPLFIKSCSRELERRWPLISHEERRSYCACSLKKISSKYKFSQLLDPKQKEKILSDFVRSGDVAYCLDKAGITLEAISYRNDHRGDL